MPTPAILEVLARQAGIIVGLAAVDDGLNDLSAEMAICVYYGMKNAI